MSGAVKGGNIFFSAQHILSGYVDLIRMFMSMCEEHEPLKCMFLRCGENDKRPPPNPPCDSGRAPASPSASRISRFHKKNAGKTMKHKGFYWFSPGFCSSAFYKENITGISSFLNAFYTFFLPPPSTHPPVCHIQ